MFRITFAKVLFCAGDVKYFSIFFQFICRFIYKSLFLQKHTTLIYIQNMENGRLEKQIRLPLDELKLAFAASCVEGLARKTGKPYIEVYERMSRVGAIENYILKNYDTLHTESREYVLEDVEEYINNKERSTAC